MLIDVGPQRMRRLLFAAIALLVGIHVILLASGPMPDEGTGLRVLFNLGAEGNIPSKFSALQLLLNSGLLLLLFVEARDSRRNGSWHWLALAAIFLFLAVDEYYSVHERLVEPVKRLLGPENVLEYAWVLPYSGLLLVFAAAFQGFWKGLPSSPRREVAVAALIYVGGAVGMEIFGSLVAARLGETSTLYALEVVLEESMEMAGCALFTVALLRLLQQRTGNVTLYLDSLSIERHGELLKDIAAANRRKGERRLATG